MNDEYDGKPLFEKDVSSNPIVQFKRWYHEVVEAGITEADAFVLSTASLNNQPAARVVLFKGFYKNAFVFYTNYDSWKGNQIAKNNRVAGVFYWKELHRQVRFEGSCKKLPVVQSRKYFDTRSFLRKLGAIASPQSQVILNRNWLETQINKLSEQYKNKPLPYPTYWGGYYITPDLVEFWQGRPNRLNDRLQYTKGVNKQWFLERLAP